MPKAYWVSTYRAIHDPDKLAAYNLTIRELTETHPDLAGRGAFDLPYVTATYRWVRD